MMLKNNTSLRIFPANNKKDVIIDYKFRASEEIIKKKCIDREKYAGMSTLIRPSDANVETIGKLCNNT